MVLRPCQRISSTAPKPTFAPAYITLGPLIAYSPNFFPPLSVANCTTPSCTPCHSCRWSAKVSNFGFGICGNIPIFKIYKFGRNDDSLLIGLQSALVSK